MKHPDVKFKLTSTSLGKRASLVTSVNQSYELKTDTSIYNCLFQVDDERSLHMSSVQNPG